MTLSPSAPYPRPTERYGQRPAPAPIRVLYICGLGRSGSTILDRMLGQEPGFASFGELSKFWSHVVVAPQRCGCGESFTSCSWWVKLAEESPEIFDRARAASVYHLHEKFLRSTLMPRLWWGPTRRRVLLRFAPSYHEALFCLYGALAEAVSGGVIVDSSKSPIYGYLLASMPELDVRLVHLVRDPRAVAFSWTRQQRDAGSVEGRFMHRYPSYKSTAFWTVWNETIRRVTAQSGVPAVTLRYEDLVADPQAALAAVLDLFGARPSRPGRRGVVELGVGHTVSGNPSRFAIGTVPIVLDDEWVWAQRPVDRVVATALALPLLRPYSYPVLVR